MQLVKLQIPLLHPNVGFNLPQCKDQPIGIERGRIFDSQITTNSSVRGHEAHKGRLNHESAWCAEPILPVYLQVALNTTYVICAVATQGNSSNSSSFVQEYQVEFSMDGSIWDFYRSSAGVIKVCLIILH